MSVQNLKPKEANIEEIIRVAKSSNPVGMLCMTSKTEINFIFWQKPWPSNADAWTNCFTGFINHAKNHITLDEMISELLKIKAQEPARN